MNSAVYKRIFTSVRPARVAILVDDHDDDWRDTCLRIIEFFTTVWGGKYNIIVPTDGKHISEKFWSLLEAFDPDYLYSYRKTLVDLKLSNSRRYEAILDDEVSKFEKKYPDSEVQNVRQEIDSQLQLAGNSNFHITPGLQELIKKRLAPFWHDNHVVQAGGITAKAIGHFPLTTVTEILPYCDHPEQVAAVSVEIPGIPPLWYASSFGLVCEPFSQKLQGLGLQSFRVDLGPENLRELFEIVIRGTIDDAWAGIRALRGRRKPVKDFSASLPFQFSMAGVALYQPTAYLDWEEPAVVVVGDTVEDFCLYYALARLRDRVSWLPPAWLSSFSAALDRSRAGGPRIGPHEMQLFHFSHAVLSLVHYGTGQERISLMSCSLGAEDLGKARDVMDDALLSNPGSLKSLCDVTEFSAALVRTPRLAFERDNAERSIAKQVIEGRLAEPLDTPKPKNFKTIHPYEHRWITEFRVAEYTLPRHPSLGARVIRDHRLGTHGARVGRNGVAYFCPNIGYFGGDIDWVLVKPEIALPGAFEVFRQLLDEQKYSCRVSDKGFFTQESTNDFGGLSSFALTLRDDCKRAVLEKFLDLETSNKPSVFDQGALLSSDGRRYLNFDAVQRIIGDEKPTVEFIDEMVRRTIFYRGFIFKCAYCRNADWFQIGEIREDFECKRCRRRQIYVREHWRFPREPAWYYKLDEIVFQGLQNDMVVPVLALDHLRRKSKDDFLFTPELEIEHAGPPAHRSEIDICCIAGGFLTIGEAKKDSRLSPSAAEEQQILTKYRTLAEELAATQVVFATAADEWNATTSERIKRTFEGSHIQLRLLAKNELFSAE